MDDVDYTAAETLRSVFSLFQGKGVRLVVAQVLADVKERSRYELKQLFGDDAFYDTLQDVVADFREKGRTTSR